jgi:putative intracellular protease/amidase
MLAWSTLEATAGAIVTGGLAAPDQITATLDSLRAFTNDPHTLICGGPASLPARGPTITAQPPRWPSVRSERSTGPCATFCVRRALKADPLHNYKGPDDGVSPQLR